MIVSRRFCRTDDDEGMMEGWKEGRKGGREEARLQ